MQIQKINSNESASYSTNQKIGAYAFIAGTTALIIADYFGKIDKVNSEKGLRLLLVFGGALVNNFSHNSPNIEPSRVTQEVNQFSAFDVLATTTLAVSMLVDLPEKYVYPLLVIAGAVFNSVWFKVGKKQENQKVLIPVTNPKQETLAQTQLVSLVTSKNIFSPSLIVQPADDKICSLQMSFESYTKGFKGLIKKSYTEKKEEFTKAAKHFNRAINNLGCVLNNQEIQPLEYPITIVKNEPRPLTRRQLIPLTEESFQ